MTAVGRSAPLGTPAVGGVLRRTIRMAPGAATCTPVTATLAGTASIRSSGFLSVACGIKINLFDYRLFVYL